MGDPGVEAVVWGRRIITTNPFAIALEPMALQRLIVRPPSPLLR